MAIDDNTIGVCPFRDPRRLFHDLAQYRAHPALSTASAFDDAVVVSRYDEIVEVLNQPDVFSSKPTVPEPPPFLKPVFAGRVPEKSTLLNWDNPDHGRLKKIVASFFVPRQLKRFEPRIRSLAHGLIDSFVASGEASIKRQFALPLPLKVIALVAGLDPGRWEWIGTSLALFGGHEEFRTGTPEKQVRRILEIHDHISELIQARKNDRRDDLISHIWNERDAGMEMDDMEHLAMIPGLLLAGHETTTNLLCMGLSHLLHNGLWEQANKDEASRTRALEECLRFESAITGMKRLATRDTTVGGEPIKAGTILWVAYNSGSRDPKYFAKPDNFDPSRTSTMQHLGFGKGIHACLGAPLARILLHTEFSVLAERLPGLRLVTPYNDIVYGHVHEGRAVRNLDVAWDMAAACAINPVQASQAHRSQNGAQEYDMVVRDAKLVTNQIVQITLASTANSSLPQWQPGAHIDVNVGDLGWRQYSLCSSPSTPNEWQIAVLRDDGGLGGSKFIHENLKSGTHLTVRGPRNHFALAKADRYVFVAGGIGITPIIPMLEYAKQAKANYKLIYLGKQRESMAFASELEAEHPVEVWLSQENGRFGFPDLAMDLTAGARVYCCGPSPLIRHLEKLCKDAPPGALTVERFAAVTDTNWIDRPFTAVMGKSGRRLHVPADRTLLDVLRSNDVTILSTCSKGTCGTCEVGLLSGIPEHRDVVLSADEKLQAATMMSCVSRCIGTELTLDLW